MEWSLQDIENFLLVPLADGVREKLILELSSTFTTKRERVKSYGLDSRLVSAYTLYFTLSNMEKLYFLLDILPVQLREELRISQLIDYGCGPGTFGLAWWNFFGGDSSSIIEIDRSKEMVKQARKLIGGLVGGSQFSFYSLADINRIKVDARCCLLFGNSMNEMSEAEVLSRVEFFKPKYLLFIEPGTKEVFQRIKSIRSKLYSRGFSTIYPCHHSSSCPMEESNWCHQVVRSSYPADYESLCQRLKKDRRQQPVSLSLLKRSEHLVDDNEDYTHARLIQLLKETKYSFIFQVCISREGKNSIESIEVLKKRYKRQQQKELARLPYGKDLYYLPAEKKGDLWRVELVGDMF